MLWRHDPTRVLPIASLTKMMTALVVADRVTRGLEGPDHQARRCTTRARASACCRAGKWIGVNTMLYGLLLPSGNDAAIALAQRAAGGSVPRFVALMNERGASRWACRARTSPRPSGFEDTGNHSCAADLAAIARAVLREPRLARIVRKREAVLPFPIKGGKLYLYNHNPLLRQGYPGTHGHQDRLHRRRGPLPGRHRAARARSSSASSCWTRPTRASRRRSCSTAASRPQPPVTRVRPGG